MKPANDALNQMIDEDDIPEAMEPEPMPIVNRQQRRREEAKQRRLEKRYKKQYS